MLIDPIKISNTFAIGFLIIFFVLPILITLMFGSSSMYLSSSERLDFIQAKRANVYYSKYFLVNKTFPFFLSKVYFFENYLVIVLFGVNRIYYDDLRWIDYSNFGRTLKMKQKSGLNVAVSFFSFMDFEKLGIVNTKSIEQN